MIVDTKINFDSIIALLKMLPKEKQYRTSYIDVARGRYLYERSFLKRLKKFINDKENS